ncbi:GNAT family N-acetyltransferase [Flexithrix dorotheae]|uniref:GNAT family N-acetyltransferase n=1 Tax=Flexithrix dorotheae TaxID=70993 RepID=UPI00036C8867|nr:GNAT family protein [Flexithrix dorotheae]
MRKEGPELIYSNSKFLIRPWQIGDEVTLAQNANNKKIWASLKDIFPYPYTIEDAKTWINLANSKSSTSDFAIVVNGDAVGGIGFIPGEDVYRGNMEIGFWIGEAYWGKGIMTMAVNEMVKWLFDSFQINRIFASVFAFNKGSMRVLEKAGFVLEGKFKKALIKDNQIIDEYIFSILNSKLYH